MAIGNGVVQTDHGDAGARRSAFVTVVGWAFMALGGFGTLSTCVQAVVGPFLMTVMARDPATPDWVLGFMRLYVGGVYLLLLVFIGQVVAGIGLVKRREWARRLSWWACI